MTEKAQALLPVTQGGPRITVKASCFDCPFVVSESYRVQSDSGSNVYCAHPSFEKRRRVGDTVWDTPDFCPVADIPAIRASGISHSLPGDVGTVQLADWRNEIGHPNNRFLFKRMAEAFGIDLGLDDVPTALRKIAALTPATGQSTTPLLGEEV